MNHYLINIALIYLISATFAVMISVFIFKINFIGSFWGALTVSLFGAFLGGSIGAHIPVLLNRVLHSFIPSLFGACMLLIVYRWLSVLKEY